MSDGRGTALSRVAVVGAGTMGVGIAHVFALGGVPTVLADSTPERTRAALERAVELADRLEAGACVEPGGAARIAANLTAAGSLEEAVAGAGLVVEAVLEQAPVKHAVYAAIEAGAPETAVIATNTSSLPIGELAAGLRLPGRFLGVHWFVPPLLVPCVEVIPGHATERAVVETVVGILRGLRKTPVVVGDGPGFVANRIQFAMFREAARIVEEGLATAEAVDEVVRSSFGFRLPFFGPFTIADLAGLDVYADIYAVLERGLGPAFAAPELLAANVAQGRFGVKSGGGFRELSQAEAADLADRRDRAYLALGRLRGELGL